MNIRRETFVDHFGSSAPLDVTCLGEDTRSLLEQAGVTDEKLRALGGQDGLLSEPQELEALFHEIDSLDRNGSSRSFALTAVSSDGRDVLTASGMLYESLETERERARLRQPVPQVTAAPSHATATLSQVSLPTPNQQRPALERLRAAGLVEIHLATDTPYFNQADRLWAQHPYPKAGDERSTRTLSQAGCAPTALAMADATLRKTATNPTAVADFAVERNLSGSPTGYGSDTHGLARAWGAAHGLTYTPATAKNVQENLDSIRDGLKQGGVALVSVGVDPATGKGHFTQGGHVILVNGFARDKDGREWFFVVNPGRRDQSRAPGGIDDSVLQDKALPHGAGQLRISREQLAKEMRHGLLLSSSPTRS